MKILDSVVVEVKSNSPACLETQVFFAGALELMGEDQFEQLIRVISSQAVPASLPDEQRFLMGLEKIYGVQGGRGLALRIGRIAFKHVLNEIGWTAGLQTYEFRLLPLERRLETGLQILARELGNVWNRPVTVTSTAACWLWRVEDGLGYAGRPSSGLCCYALSGLLQEFMTWAGGGRFYRTIEIECQASGSSACVFQIGKKALD